MKTRFIQTAKIPLLFVILITIIHFYSKLNDLKLSNWGIYPRELKGLYGILSSSNVKIISMGILIVWQYVSNFKSILSINFLPSNKKNVDAKINKIGKSPNNIILGGVKLMF